MLTHPPTRPRTLHHQLVSAPPPVIDNGRAINTYTMDVATNSDVFAQGAHYGVPGVKCDGQNMVDVMRAGRAVTDYVRGSGPAIMQVRQYPKSYIRCRHDPFLIRTTRPTPVRIHSTPRSLVRSIVRSFERTAKKGSVEGRGGAERKGVL